MSVWSYQAKISVRPASRLHCATKNWYEYSLAHAITCRSMHVHAVLSSKEARIRSMTEEGPFQSLEQKIGLSKRFFRSVRGTRI